MHASARKIVFRTCLGLDDARPQVIEGALDEQDGPGRPSEEEEQASERLLTYACAALGRYPIRVSLSGTLSESLAESLSGLYPSLYPRLCRHMPGPRSPDASGAKRSEAGGRSMSPSGTQAGFEDSDRAVNSHPLLEMSRLGKDSHTESVLEIRMRPQRVTRRMRLVRHPPSCHHDSEDHGI